MDFTTQQIARDFWAIEQNGVRSFLLLGEASAILVDTCFGGDLKSICDAITDKPITLLTTHSDRDHIGCDHQFPVQYMHPAEFDCYERRSGKRTHAQPMWEGDVFTVGDYRLEVILFPGHTPGSIALLERERRFLLAGDIVQDRAIFMHGDGRNLAAFAHSTRRLDQLRQAGVFDAIYSSHGSIILPAEITAELLELAEDVLRGSAVPVGPALDRFPPTVKTYRLGRAQMYY